MNWRSIVFCCLMVIILQACNNKHNSVKEYIKNADSASIAFYTNKGSSAQIIIRDKTSVKKLSEYIDGKNSPPIKCMDTGSIWFYEGGKKKMQVDFSINPDCSYFSYMMNDKIFTKIMSEDATQYLNSIEQIATDSL